MQKRTWGYSRTKHNIPETQNNRNNTVEKTVPQKSERTNVEKLLSTAGLFAVAIMLAFPVFEGERAGKHDEAVAVMGSIEHVTASADGDREVLSLPEKHTSVELGEKSFYDYIGEFFRDLIYG